MQQPDDYEKVIARAMKLLSIKSRTEAELREKLLARAVSEQVVDQVIAQLKAWRYLDDEQFAADYSSSRLQQRPLGRRRLSWELTHRKVPQPIVESTLDHAYGQCNEDELIDRAIAKRLRLRGRPRDRQQAKKLFDYLIRLGFASELVRRKVAEVCHEPLDEA